MNQPEIAIWFPFHCKRYVKLKLAGPTSLQVSISKCLCFLESKEEKNIYEKMFVIFFEKKIKTQSDSFFPYLFWQFAICPERFVFFSAFCSPSLLDGVLFFLLLWLCSSVTFTFIHSYIVYVLIFDAFRVFST